MPNWDPDEPTYRDDWERAKAARDDESGETPDDEVSEQEDDSKGSS